MTWSHLDGEEPLEVTRPTSSSKQEQLHQAPQGFDQSNPKYLQKWRSHNPPWCLPNNEEFQIL